MLGYIITAIVSVYFGYMIGGIMSSAKVSDLYNRIATAEYELEIQTKAIKQLTSAVRSVLDSVEDRMLNNAGPGAVENIRAAIAQCDDATKGRQQHDTIV